MALVAFTAILLIASIFCPTYLDAVSKLWERARLHSQSKEDFGKTAKIETSRQLQELDLDWLDLENDQDTP